jgi:hypothetical protein
MRQTLIPILLTLGTCLIICGAARFFVGEDSGYHDISIWYPIAFFVIGAGLIGIAVMNMLQIRAMLAEQAQLDAAR